MTQSLTYQQTGTAARGQAHALFAQTMGYVSATAALFALGAWLGRDLAGGLLGQRREIEPLIAAASGKLAFLAAIAVLDAGVRPVHGVSRRDGPGTFASTCCAYDRI